MNGETVKLGMPGAAQRMEASAKLMIPLQRVGTPEDAAGAMLMLASPYSSYISAQVLLQASELLRCSDDISLLRLRAAAESCAHDFQYSIACVKSDKLALKCCSNAAMLQALLQTVQLS